jgi:hypothetical protein
MADLTKQDTESNSLNVLQDEHGPVAPDIVRLVTAKSDAEIAAELKQRAMELLAPVCALLDEALRQGLLIQFDSINAQPPFFKYQVNGLRVVKHL